MIDNTISPAGEPDSAPLQREPNLPQRILVVDDEPCIRQLCSEVLIHCGYHVDAAEDGAAAWDTLQLNSYDLLVTDHKMSRLTGVGLIKKLHAARMALPVILVSGTMPTEELNRHPWLQIEAKLLKPFTADELLETVNKVLRAADSPCEQTEPPPNWLSQPLAV